MLYDLMHKDTEVLRMNLNDDDGLIQSVESVSSIQHLPVGTFQNGRMNGRDLRNWWSKRSIPASRSGIRDILQRLDVPCTTALVTRCMGHLRAHLRPGHREGRSRIRRHVQAQHRADRVHRPQRRRQRRGVSRHRRHRFAKPEDHRRGRREERMGILPLSHPYIS